MARRGKCAKNPTVRAHLQAVPATTIPRGSCANATSANSCAPAGRAIASPYSDFRYSTRSATWAGFRPRDFRLL